MDDVGAGVEHPEQAHQPEQREQGQRQLEARHAGEPVGPAPHALDEQQQQQPAQGDLPAVVQIRRAPWQSD
jgi:hypothetical protein